MKLRFASELQEVLTRGCCMQVSYVLDTEDLLLRRRPASTDGRSAQSAAQQSSRFAEWLSEKFQERGGDARTLSPAPATPHGGAYPRALPPMMA